jgi:hypothetical protein
MHCGHLSGLPVGQAFQLAAASRSGDLTTEMITSGQKPDLPLELDP